MTASPLGELIVMRIALASQLIAIITLALSAAFPLVAEESSEASQVEEPNDVEQETETDAPEPASESLDQEADLEKPLAPNEEAGEAMINIEDDVLAYEDDDSLSTSPLSLQILGGRKWFSGDDTLFYADQLNFAAEWYALEEFPLKIGPSLNYTKLLSAQEGYNSGQLLEASLRISSFWDFGFVSPFIAMNYVFYSSGSLDYQRERSNRVEKATYDISLSGYDLSAGLQIQAWEQNYLIVETSIANSETYEISGNLGTINIDPNTGDQSREAIHVSKSNTWSFKRLSIGLMFEM